MRPWFERVTIPQGQSWRLFDRRLPEFPFNWHYHPEFELTLTVNSRGMRFVGDHVETYDDGDLVLLGPNLPHAWQSQAVIDGEGPHRAVVCWFTHDWIEAMIALAPELAGLRPLLAESGRGVVFGPATARAARERLLALVDIRIEQRVLDLLSILVELSGDPRRGPLASGAVSLGEVPRDKARMARVLDWLHEHYTRPIELAPLAEIAHLSPSQLQRMFKRSTRMSISAYVAQLRIGHACAMLAQGDRPIGVIAGEVGFADGPHLTRQFHAAKGMPPRAYRALFRKM